MKRELDIECKSCNGTGIYVGFGERDGASVICKSCSGTGKQHFEMEYKEFKGIKTRDDITRVYKHNPGYCISPKIINFKEFGIIDLTKEGVSYEEFKNGKTPGYIEQLECPMLADQSACHNIPGFVDKCNELHDGSLWGISLSKCTYQKNKAQCWERFKNVRL